MTYTIDIFKDYERNECSYLVEIDGLWLAAGSTSTKWGAKMAAKGIVKAHKKGKILVEHIEISS